jgi:hypothetical protein
MPITPDTKDWTWVLTRPCDECGFDAAAIAVADVGRLVRDNAAVWRLVLAGDDVTTRPSDDRWSPLEYACHVRDVFRLYDERLNLMLVADDPVFANWDQDVTAVEERYNEQDPARVAEEIEAAAATFAEQLDGLTPGDMERRGTRSDGAVFTVDGFTRYMIHDPIHHLWDVGARQPGS